MKFLNIVFVVIALASFGAFAQEQGSSAMVTVPAEAQTTRQGNFPLPKKLSGDWETPDRMRGQLWSLENINQVKHTAMLTFYAGTNTSCHTINLPVSFQYDGNRLQLDASGRMTCGNKFVADLAWDQKGVELSGMVYVTETNTYPELKARLRGAN